MSDNRKREGEEVMANVWKPGDMVYAARMWGVATDRPEVTGRCVVSAGAKKAILGVSHDALGYRTHIGHDEGYRTPREALVALGAELTREADSRRAQAKKCEADAAKVAEALASLVMP